MLCRPWVPEVSCVDRIRGEVRRKGGTNDSHPPKFLTVDKQNRQYRVLVQIELEKYLAGAASKRVIRIIAR